MHMKCSLQTCNVEIIEEFFPPHENWWSASWWKWTSLKQQWRKRKIVCLLKCWVHKFCTMSLSTETAKKGDSSKVAAEPSSQTDIGAYKRSSKWFLSNFSHKTRWETLHCMWSLSLTISTCKKNHWKSNQ